MMDKNKLRDVKTYDLCRAYGNNMWRAYKVKDELIFRKRQNDLKRSINLVSELPPPEDWEWELIERKSIRVGMSECGLLASWGKPRKINGSSHGPSQWVYGNYGSYVYVQRREITAWQD